MKCTYADMSHATHINEPFELLAAIECKVFNYFDSRVKFDVLQMAALVEGVFGYDGDGVVD